MLNSLGSWNRRGFSAIKHTAIFWKYVILVIRYYLDLRFQSFEGYIEFFKKRLVLRLAFKYVIFIKKAFPTQKFTEINRF